MNDFFSIYEVCAENINALGSVSFLQLNKHWLLSLDEFEF